MEIWPNFFIVGAPKAGTTSLYSYLRQHPKIYMSPKKEPEYFHKNRPNITSPIPVKNTKEYLSLFNNVKDETAIGEASAGYLLDPESHALIHEQIPDARIIISLRDPVERAYSQHLNRKNLGIEELSFSDAIRRDVELMERGKYTGATIKGSYYSKALKRYFDTFGKKNVKVLIFEEFVQDVRSTIRDVVRFLDINDVHQFNDEIYHDYRIPKGKLEEMIIKSTTVRKIAENIIFYANFA